MPEQLTSQETSIPSHEDLLIERQEELGLIDHATAEAKRLGQVPTGPDNHTENEVIADSVKAGHRPPKKFHPAAPGPKDLSVPDGRELSRRAASAEYRPLTQEDKDRANLAIRGLRATFQLQAMDRIKEEAAGDPKKQQELELQRFARRRRERREHGLE